MVGLRFLIKKVSLYNNLISEQSEPITSTVYIGSVNPMAGAQWMFGYTWKASPF